MGATQSITDPLEIGHKFSFPTHLLYLASSYHFTSFAHPAFLGRRNAYLPSRAAGCAVIRSGEFRSLTAARAGDMRCCPRSYEREIEACPRRAARDGCAERREASLRSRGGRAHCERCRHMLGLGDWRCSDNELRQWMLCVTFSASPKTVTHAYCLLAH
jgi:hypothetical protein